MSELDLDAYVRQTAALLRIPLEEALVAGVSGHLRIAAGLAEQIMDLPLQPDDEPAPRFEP